MPGPSTPSAVPGFRAVLRTTLTDAIQHAAEEVEAAGHPDRAADLRRGADLLASVIRQVTDD